MPEGAPAVTRRWFQVVDDFYPNADQIRSVALRMTYSEPEDVSGWRSPSYLPRNIKHRIETSFGLSIRTWDSGRGAAEAGNGMFFISCASGLHADPAVVHFDQPMEYKSLLVYLTPRAPHDTGISFWQHRSTGLVAAPTKVEASELGSSVADLRSLLERDAWNQRRWIELDRIQNVYNRAIGFRAGMLHSATRHFGSVLEKARLYHSFHFAGSRTRA